MAKIPIDPLDGPQYALKGRIVTMNDKRDVIENGILYIDKGRIVAVQKSDAKAPSGFEKAETVDTKGTIYPGLIELHNHLCYNTSKLWQVPKEYDDRDQWRGAPDYRKLITGPANILGSTPGYVEAVIRYVECKCIMGGVTTSQGITLSSNKGIEKYYKGLVRNVEATEDSDLPDASTRIGDVASKDADGFYKNLKKQTCLLLHLSEGKDEKEHNIFLMLKKKDGEWAITNALAGIHCVALTNDDFKIMKEKGASMIWSPLSNLLLYKKTADIASAVKNKLLIGIGSDWSPSGSKNLFGEMKVARIVSKNYGVMDDDADILALATINAAKILKWDKELGSIESGKRADLTILNGKTGDAYKTFLKSPETAISLVIINGIPRYGYESLMNNWSDDKENIKVGGKKYQLHLKQETAFPQVDKLKLNDAITKLTFGLNNLLQLAKDLEKPKPRFSLTASDAEPQWSLVLDHNNEEEGDKLRFTGSAGVRSFDTFALAQPLSEIVEKMELDEITVADDKDFLENLKKEINLPEYIKDELVKMY